MWLPFRFSLLFFLLCSGSIRLAAQHCGFQHETNAAIERFTEGYVRDFKNQLPTRAVVKIPVVVHIVWRTFAEDVSDEIVRQQIDSLNKDFRRRNFDIARIVVNSFKTLPADCEIEFCLAKRDTNGRATTGIVRRQTHPDTPNVGGTFDGNRRRVFYRDFNGDNIWRPSEYLNIYVCDLGVNGWAASPAGLANGTILPEEDAIVVDYRAFGNASTRSGRNRGRTLVHEMGHYFNLLHIWGSDATCNDDDEVTDTPRQANLSEGCPSQLEASVCEPRLPNMSTNYMDYSNDDCSYLFTLGQKARMWATLDGYRASLKNSMACEEPVSTEDLAREIRIFPNPTSQFLNLQFPLHWAANTKTLQIVDWSGRLVLQKVVDTEGGVLDLSGLPNGVYFLHLNIANQILTRKIILAR
jgi:Pregnancy-associated plasma protein-A/Secretion system C-terminal sorting domain